MAYSNAGNVYEDHLVGKYQYIEDGVEVVNTFTINNIDAANFWKNTGVMIRSIGYRSDDYVSLAVYDIKKREMLMADAKILTSFLVDSNGYNTTLLGSQLSLRLRFEEGSFIEEAFSPDSYKTNFRRETLWKGKPLDSDNYRNWVVFILDR